MKGWLVLSSRDADPDDTTPWLASFWEFCASNCTTRFGEAWHLSPEQSLMFQAESTTIPRQAVVLSPKGANNAVRLPFATSLYDLKKRVMPAEADIAVGTGRGYPCP